MNESVHTSFSISDIVNDILEHLGVILVAESGHGKSFTAFTITREAMSRKNLTVVIFSPSTIWRRKFGKINCVKVGTRDFNPVKPKEKVELYQTNLRETVFIDLDKKWCFESSKWLKDLLDSKQHILFEIKYKNSRRIKHFEATILKYLYNQQERMLDINPNYNHHYLIGLEEIQNSFGSYSMNSDSSLELMTIFTQSRTDANIHYLGICQRLNDVSTKVCERLRLMVGLILGENALRKVRTQLPKHLKHLVQELPQRTWLYLNGKHNPIIQIPIYRKKGKPTYLKPTPQKPKVIRKSKPQFQTKGFLEWIFSKFSKEEKQSDIPSVYDESEDFDTELEEDLGLLGELEDEW
jgi:hypothetical protein